MGHFIDEKIFHFEPLSFYLIYLCFLLVFYLDFGRKKDCRRLPPQSVSKRRYAQMITGRPAESRKIVVSTELSTKIMVQWSDDERYRLPQRQ